MKYFDELCRSMEWLGQQPDIICLGQSVKFKGTGIYNTLTKFPEEKKYEFIVAEELQMGTSIGLGITGFTVLSIFPRMDFLLLAMNQLITHLDKFPELGYNPKVIIRTAVGSVYPLFPGIQHCSDHTDILWRTCKNIKVVRLECTDDIFLQYQHAYYRNGSTILIELADSYSK